MIRKSRTLGLALLAATIAANLPVSAKAVTVRFATFNLALYGTRAGEVLGRLETGADPQARHLAEIIQRVRPDVLVLNEVDYDADAHVLAAFCDKYLNVPQHVSQAPAGPAEAIQYPHRRAFATNTGEHSGLDLDRNGRIDATPGAPAYAGDCWGYGVYPGQYAFAVLSKYPFDNAAIREFRTFLWRDLPGAELPDDPATPAPADWYAPEIAAQFRLSSKNHCDVPVVIEGRSVHLLLSHPTPPVFDGRENRNGLRNHAELAFWRAYIDSNLPAPSPSRGGLGRGEAEGTGDAETKTPSAMPRLPSPATFLIAGDLNGDPHDGDGSAGIAQLLAAPQILDYPPPVSRGGAEAARVQGRANSRHRGDPAQDTEDAADSAPGNLRLDYLLPSADLKVVDSGVFWPTADDPLAPLVAGADEPASSDHRLVWVDIEFSP